MVRVSGKIRRLLIESGAVDAEEWAAAKESGKPVVDALIERGSLKQEQLYETLCTASKVPPLDVERVQPEPSAVEALPQEMCIEHCVLPLFKNGDTLTVAISDPFDVLLLDDLNILSGCKVRPFLSHPAAIHAVLERLFDHGKSAVEDLMDEVMTTSELDVQVPQEEQEEFDLTSLSGDGEVPAVKLANLILLRALKDKSSDIHVEPGDRSVRIRFRVDGRLVPVMTPPKSLLPALISRLKILASLDISERFTPQDGKFQIRYEGRMIDFRLSTLPVVGGEKAVMRILDSSGVSMRLEDMGFEPSALADFQESIHSAYGMVLVTGPTGSGKSTTLYSAVKEVSTPAINVVTVEDPVEYRMEGVNQVPVNPKRGMTFAGALRSILRQDPDVVLVGEIRDVETAEIGVKAALTGHLVLSTLHTNDAPGAVTRLVDMGVDPFMVSSSLLCVAAQRLMRKLCTHCRQPLNLPEEELLSIGFQESELESELFSPNPQGCPRCTGGYKGRFAILETLSMTEKVSRMIVEGKSSHDIKAQGIEDGMLTLRRVGILNAIRGRTSLEEVLRVTLKD